jgi:hypothetical protein
MTATSLATAAPPRISEPIFGPEMERRLAKRERQVRARHWSDASRIWRAMVLASDLPTCEALLRGVSVPVDRLEPKWVRRFGRRP